MAKPWLKKFLQGPLGIVVFGWGFALIALLGFISLAIFVEWAVPGWSFDEVARISNVDIDAVLVERHGDLIASYDYYVFVLPAGAKPDDPQKWNAHFHQAVRSERARGVNMRWKDRDTLAIEYLDAGPTVDRGPAVVGDHVIHIDSISGITDVTAPAGPMFRGLFRRAP